MERKATLVQQLISGTTSNPSNTPTLSKNGSHNHQTDGPSNIEIPIGYEEALVSSMLNKMNSAI